MKKNSDFVNIIVAVLVLVLGLVCLIAPMQIFSFLIFVLGAAAIVFGLYDLFKLRPLVDDKPYRMTILIRGLLSILFGILAIVLRVKMGSAVVTVLKTIFAVYLIICAFADFYIFAELKKVSSAVDLPVSRKFALFKGLISLLLAVLLFVMSSDTLISLIMRIAGGLLMISGLIFGIYAFKNRAIVVEADSVKDAE